MRGHWGILILLWRVIAIKVPGTATRCIAAAARSRIVASRLGLLNTKPFSEARIRTQLEGYAKFLVVA
jgi:hypothetical protein